jgi:ribosomal protein L21
MVVKYKNKTRYLRTKGHRQDYTKIEVTKIGA